MNILSSISSVEVLAAVALGLVIGMIVLLVMQVRSSTQINKITYPAYEYTIKKAQAEADEVIETAQEKAREIISLAEEESIKLLGERKAESAESYKAYSDSLESLKNELREALAGIVDEARGQSGEISETFLDNLKTQDEEMRGKIGVLSGELDGIPVRLREQSDVVMEKLNERLARAGEQLEHALLSTHEENTHKIGEYFEKEFEAAQRELEQYREGRKALIDAHIETLVRDVVRVALKKELTRPDHAELVRSALEEAKSAGAL